MRSVPVCLVVCAICGAMTAGCRKEPTPAPPEPAGARSDAAAPVTATAPASTEPRPRAATRPADADAAEQWGRAVADAFLSAAGSGSYTSGPAVAYLSPRYKDQLDKQTSSITYRFEKWSIASATASPQADEVIVKGTFQSILGGGPATRTRPFTLLLVKSKEDGKWRVDSFVDSVE
jgi:hypothetical protein